MTAIMQLDLRKTEVAEELWLLQHAAYRVEAALIGVPDLPPLRDTVATLQAARETFWGCRDEEGELIGVIATERENETEVIARMMVHPSRFRQGIAGKLLGHVLQASPASTPWEVTAEERNLPAIALYERFGFREAGRFRPREDIGMIRMVRPATKT
ncbi:GNAT family N-acetyltransferase [Cohnella nanjingensis]|uniref:GNAT family N-acetyltransferase n=1 Tax=Cohnella nanjingensis TaxID=1387779 RepID=A0A7X0VGA8_9BACL|nr:GNAT family N-acetyltransferase [Cohnella nanjingensis]MBB6672656.1 GNAT family N-acetyltransferase [Cohnella nanjingensis]